jgi:hypothetical protein
MGAPVLSTQRGFAFWGAHNAITFSQSRYSGSWLPIYKYVGTSQPMFGDEVQRDKLTWSYGVAAVREHLSRMPYLTVMKIWRLVSPTFETSNKVALLALAIGWIATGPFVAFGIWRIAAERTEENWRWLVLIVPLLATGATAIVFYGSSRFRDALAPIFVVIAAFGWSRLRDIITRYRSSPLKAAVENNETIFP